MSGILGNLYRTGAYYKYLKAKNLSRTPLTVFLKAASLYLFRKQLWHYYLVHIQGSHINSKRFCIGVLDSFQLSYSV